LAKKQQGESRMDEEVYDMQVRICKAFASVPRLRMLDMLGTSERSCSEIQNELGISAANLSQHLAILRSAGVVATRRDGKQIWCSLAIPEVKCACEQVRSILRAQIRKAGRSVLSAEEPSARASGRAKKGTTVHK
jgi:ArsR family transcriptional regulator